MCTLCAWEILEYDHGFKKASDSAVLHVMLFLFIMIAQSRSN